MFRKPGNDYTRGYRDGHEDGYQKGFLEGRKAHLAGVEVEPRIRTIYDLTGQKVGEIEEGEPPDPPQAV
jgi:flagellar biosynthesis/type III secretory pathway protein FliH